MKMKVGDIELDAQQGISFGGSPAARAPSQTLAPVQTPAAAAPRADARRVASVGLGASLVASLLLTALAGAQVLPSAALLSWLSVGAMGLWRVRCGLAASQTQLEAAPPAGLLTGDSALSLERETRVLDALSQANGPMTARALQARLGWTEVTLLEALAPLIAKERVVEDLDLESGQWCYAQPMVLGLGSLGSGSMTAEQRLDALRQAQHTTTSR